MVGTNKIFLEDNKIILLKDSKKNLLKADEIFNLLVKKKNK